MKWYCSSKISAATTTTTLCYKNNSNNKNNQIGNMNVPIWVNIPLGSCNNKEIKLTRYYSHAHTHSHTSQQNRAISLKSIIGL